MVFAEKFPRNSTGQILFPADMSEWKKWFKRDKKGHPAPMNFYLLQELVLHFTKPGDILLDPMAGGGTLAWAATQGRAVVLIELIDAYIDLIRTSVLALGVQEKVTILHGDCRKFLPLVGINHIIFSPPYADTRGQKSALEQRVYRGTEHYRESAASIGNLSTFLFRQAMMQIYKLLANSIEIGGTVSIVLADRVEGGVLVHLSKDCIQTCNQANLKLLLWEKRHSETFMRRLTEKQHPGQPKMDYEDILVFRKEG